MKFIKTYENYGTPQKFDINGVSVSLLTGSNCEIYFVGIGKVINLGNDPKFAEAVFFRARLLAEDGKKEQQIYDHISTQLSKAYENHSPEYTVNKEVLDKLISGETVMLNSEDVSGLYMQVQQDAYGRVLAVSTLPELKGMTFNYQRKGLTHILKKI